MKGFSKWILDSKSQEKPGMGKRIWFSPQNPAMHAKLVALIFFAAKTFSEGDWITNLSLGIVIN